MTIMHIPAVLTMTSREIADLVEARHNDVVATIERLFSKGLLRSSRKTRREDTGGRPIEVYDLIERDTHLVVSGYSDEHRARVIDRWQELEAQQSRPAELSRMEILKLAMESEEARLEAEKQLALAAPKAQALERIALSDGSLCITNAAKVLGVQPKKLFAWLQEHQWIYRRAGGSGFVGYQGRIQTSYLDHKVTLVSRSDGSEKTVERVLITPKGLAKLSEALNAKEAA